MNSARSVFRPPEKVRSPVNSLSAHTPSHKGQSPTLASCCAHSKTQTTSKTSQLPSGRGAPCRRPLRCPTFPSRTAGHGLASRRTTSTVGGLHVCLAGWQPRGHGAASWDTQDGDHSAPVCMSACVGSRV